MKSYGLVLGGGGAKGGYEIGVWKALRELNIPIKAVAGASVGALNGALVVQDDYETAYNLWTSLTMNSVIRVEKEIAVVEEASKKQVGIMDAALNAVKNGGLDVTPLKELLQNILNEEKIRESKVDFGIITFSLTDFKPVKMFKNEIPVGQLGNYLLASSCFPAFKPQEIGDKRFIDGGVCDNIPVSLLVEKGIKDIIAVDVSGPGLNRRIDKKGLNVIYIKNSQDLGGTLDFDGERSKKNIEIGYYDTLKAFGKLKGNNYFIIPSEEEIQKSKDKYIRSLTPEELKKMYYYLGIDWNIKIPYKSKLIIDRILRTIQQYSQGSLNGDYFFPAMAEIAAEQLQVERVRTYTLDELVGAIIAKYEDIKSSKDFNEYIDGIKNLIVSRNQIEFDREIKKIFIEGKFIISYNVDLNETDEKVKRFRRFIAVAFPKIAIANLFIALVLSKRS